MFFSYAIIVNKPCVKDDLLIFCSPLFIQTFHRVVATPVSMAFVSTEVKFIMEGKVITCVNVLMVGRDGFVKQVSVSFEICASTIYTNKCACCVLIGPNCIFTS